MAPLRIAVVVDDPERLAPWELRLFDRIASDARFDLCGLGLDRAPVAKAAGIGTALDRVLHDFERRAFLVRPAAQAPAFEAARARLPLIDLGATSAGPGIAKASIEALCGLSADVVLWHGAALPGAGLAAVARLGIWMLEPFGAGPGRARLAGVRESLAGAPVTLARLRALDGAAPGGRIIAEAGFNTDPIPARNSANTAEKAVSLVLRELGRAAGGLSGSTAAASSGPSEALTPLPTPALATSLARGARIGAALAGSLHDRLSRKAGRRQNMWSLFFGRGDIETADLARCIEAPPAPGEFWADPFLMRRNGETYVLFENYVYAEGRAKISAGRWRDGGLEVMGDALVRPYHLSFPLVFEAEGAVYMVPETCGAGRIEVWRAVDFPLEWELYATALDGVSAADTVLFEDAGRWWMFTNISHGPVEDHGNELHVFAIDGPALKRVEPHPLNPVVIDSRRARGAGRIARRNGRLIRPSQNNSHGVYGWGLNLMEITRLDREGYEERLVRSFTPDFRPGLAACHHIDSAGDLFVIDACRKWG